MYRVRHKSVNTPLSHERLVVRTWLAVYTIVVGGKAYTASKVRTISRSWDKGVLTDLCLTRVLTDLCLTLYIENVCSNHISELCYNTFTVYSFRDRCAYWQQYIENFKIFTFFFFMFVVGYC